MNKDFIILLLCLYLYTELFVILFYFDSYNGILFDKDF